MLDEDLKEIWKHSSETENIRLDLSRLMTELNNKMNRIEKTIRKRDITEISASVFGILIFGYFAYEIPFPITKIACLLSIVWFGYVIYRFKNNKKRKRPVDLSLAFRDQLENQEKNMQQEAKLLNTILYWYVLPPLFANILFIIGFGNPADYNWAPLIVREASEFLPIALNMKIIYVASSVLFNVFVIWINKRAVRKNLNPVIKDINIMILELEAED